MVNDLHAIYQTLGIFSTIMLVFLALFWHADDQVHLDIRKRLSNFLLGDASRVRSTEMTRILVELFQSIFDKNPITWRFFGRSIIASILSMFVMIVVWFIANPDQTPNNILDKLLFILIIFSIGGVLNIIPDFISLIQSHIIIQRMARVNAALKIFLLLIADLILTTAIVLSVLFLFGFFLDQMFSGGSLVDDFNTHQAFVEGIALNVDDGKGGWLGIFIYTTYFTSIWIWLYMAATVLLKFRGIMQPFQKILRIQDRPFRSVGIVAFLPGFIVAMIIESIV